jgi:hypothetical protein
MPRAAKPKTLWYVACGTNATLLLARDEQHARELWASRRKKRLNRLNLSTRNHGIVLVVRPATDAEQHAWSSKKRPNDNQPSLFP